MILDKQGDEITWYGQSTRRLVGSPKGDEAGATSPADGGSSDVQRTTETSDCKRGAGSFA